MSDEQKMKLRESARRNHQSGTVYSAESQVKRVAKVAGQKRSAETKMKISLALIGKPKGPMSESEKEKRSVSLKGRKKPDGFGEVVANRMKEVFTNNNPNRRPELQRQCPHCGKIVGPTNYSRWHGDKCRNK